MTPKRETTNATMHLTGPLGDGVASVSGHLVVERHAHIANWSGLQFGGARVEVRPGTTVHALDVGATYRLEPSGEWQTWKGAPAVPELSPPPVKRTKARPTTGERGKRSATELAQDYGPSLAAGAALGALAFLLEE